MTQLWKTLVVLSLLFVTSAPLAAQVPEAARAIGEKAKPAVEHDGKAVLDELSGNKSTEALSKLSEDWRKYQEEQKKYYERYATTDREYFGWFSSTELKKPFNQLVDDAIVSIRAKSSAKVFKNAGNQEIVKVLSAESQALPPPDRLNLQLQESWYKPDALEVTKPGSSESASVRMGSLKDYISEAIDRLTYPPTDPSKIVVHPNKGAQTLQVVPAN